jgi:hypothetical protein
MAQRGVPPFNGVGWIDIALTFNHIAVGAFLCCRDTTSCSMQSGIARSPMS